MTMPWGATEEPDVVLTEQQSIPVHVVSTGVKPGKAVAPEFGRWRTFLVTSVVGQDLAVPGARRLMNRSLRRHRCHIIVNGSGATISSTPSVVGFPSIAVSGTAIQNPFNYPVSVVLAGFTATQVFVNGILVGASNGTYIVPAYGSLSVTYTILGTTTPSGIATTGPQASTDGIIVGGREEVAALANSNNPLLTYTPGGYLQIGDNVRYESQQELWVAYPPSNTAPVIVTTCDEVYASDSFEGESKRD